MWGAPTAQKVSGQLAKNTDAKQEMDSKVESELESLSQSDSKTGQCKGG